MQIEELKRQRDGQQWEESERQAFEAKVAARWTVCTLLYILTS